MPKPVFYQLRKAYCERDNCHRSFRACYQSIACCHSRLTDADARKTKDSGVAYLSGRGRGDRCFCRRELITIVTPLSRPGSAKTAASVCLYSVYRKQERSLFTAALRADIKCADRHHPAASDGGPVVSHTQRPVGDRVPPSRLLFDRCATAPETWPLLTVSHTHPSCVQRRPEGGRR